ncbi:uncharacterized protein FTJAE_8380 [Fusarium tjaetaba]|uniref:Uncharacterized protein n=1 Tax=Fusarium tjaetaba TaxID=1567544 RepID=A0A8H5R6J0_9HYPO|nr:uncharacterized protein FTJAE_8380 [Fusarium tjaetaba]KAF5630010.1 hypothetical protein FTJAE_8380 [Fusarium tjaetaba]
MLGLNEFLDDPITDEVGKEFKVIMDDKHENCADTEKAKEELEDKPEGSHRLGQAEAMGGDEGLKEGEIMEDGEMATRERGGEDRDADLADER